MLEGCFLVWETTEQSSEPVIFVSTVAKQYDVFLLRHADVIDSEQSRALVPVFDC